MNHARAMWEVSERFHQLCYVAPEVRTAGTEAGLKGFWMSYFATRAAPMGPVTAATVEAVFFYYSPTRVGRAIPDAWRYSDPETVLAARYRAMDLALRRQLGPKADSPIVAEAAKLHYRSLDSAEVLGRPLYAAWSGLPRPTEPHLDLWHATTLQREYRNGCHLIALGAAGLDGCQSIVSQAAVDEGPEFWITDEAGWSEAAAARARDRLQARGWLDESGVATDAGRRGRAGIEAMTDRLDGRRWAEMADSDRTRLHQLMSELVADFPPDDQLDWQQVYGPNKRP